MEIVEEDEAEESPHEVHKSAISNPSPQTRGGGNVRQTLEVISASLGAMRPLVGKLDKLLLDPPEGCSSKKVKEKIHLLKEDVKMISTCLDKLSELENPPPTTKCWMNEARDLSYKIEDYIDSLLFVKPVDLSLVVDNIKTTKSLRKWFNHVKTPKSHEQIAATLSEFRKNAQEKIERRKVYVLSDSKIESSLSHRVVSVSHVLPMPYEETTIVIIDGRMNEFINSLANDGDEQLKVVSVLGSACLGKTTLARLLYGRIGKRYHCRAFIRVSKKPDMKRIFHDMLSQLQRQDSTEYCNEVDLIDKIKKYLRDKRYLIILDDIWAASVWDVINHALPKGSHGSRIITTTQIEDVALTCCRYQSERVFKMKPLDYHHSRKLFFNRLFGSESDCPEELKEVSNKIVEICGGLPLATISMASLLASQPIMSTDLLRYIHESLSSLFSANPNSERTRQALNLSFNNLPQYLKTCLMYLSMHQEGYKFCKDDLVKQWMAEGFIDTTKGQDMKKVAESYLHQLIDRRFIQPICINYNNEVLSCAVHDVVHDLIAQKSAEDNFIVAIDYGDKNVALSHKARRLSILFGDAKYAKAPAYIIKSQVRSLTFLGLFECMPSITEFKLLRVLNLQLSGRGCNGDSPVDLTGISELYQLRYLKIASDVCIKLPNNGLQCLETLDIMDTGVAYAPCDIHLPNLLHLSLPFEKNLLDCFVPMGSLGMLNYLQDLHLTTPSTPSYVVQKRMEALGSLMGGHVSLKTVQISFKNAMVRGASKVTISWDDLAPPPFLQRFECSLHSCIRFYHIPKWVGKHDNLCILKISVRELMTDCVDILRGLPALAALSLDVQRAPIERIIFDKAGFSVLKYFKLSFTSGIAWLTFEKDAMPNLQKIKLVFKAIPPMDQQAFLYSSKQLGTAVISIEQMASLKEVSVKFGGAAADLEYALRTFVSNHPSNPTVNMQLVDHSSYGDESTKQKQQPDEILEVEPDEYDTALERPADERISRSPLSKEKGKRISWSSKSSSLKHFPAMGCLPFLHGEVKEEYPAAKSVSVQFFSKTSTEREVRSGSDLNSMNVSDMSAESIRRTHYPSFTNLRVFTFSELKNATHNFSWSRVVGEGEFGCVYRGVVKNSAEPTERIKIAVKKLNHKGAQAQKELLTKMNVIGIVEHPNLVKLIGYCADDDEWGMQWLLVYEYMTNRSVDDHLAGRSASTLSWPMRLKVALDAACGLKYLHEEMDFKVICGDLKSSKILLDENWNAKLSDFGLARHAPPEGLTHVSTAVVGTEGYAAPEYMQFGRLTAKCDIWGYGVLLYELITGRRPIDKNRPTGEQMLLDWVRPYVSDVKQIPTIIDPLLEGHYNLKSVTQLVGVASRCLLRRPKSRPNMSEVYEMVQKIVVSVESAPDSPRTTHSYTTSNLSSSYAVSTEASTSASTC